MNPISETDFLVALHASARAVAQAGISAASPEPGKPLGLGQVLWLLDELNAYSGNAHFVVDGSGFFHESVEALVIDLQALIGGSVSEQAGKQALREDLNQGQRAVLQLLKSLERILKETRVHRVREIASQLVGGLSAYLNLFRQLSLYVERLSLSPPPVSDALIAPEDMLRRQPSSGWLAGIFQSLKN